MLIFLGMHPRLRLGALLLLATVAALALGASPVKAWDNGFNFFSFPFFDRRPQQMWPWQQQQQQPPPQPEPRQQIDYSKAPPAKKSDTSATTHIVVMGDAMADWLAYGLEDAFSESPEIGVVRKHRTYSGLIHGDSKNAYDWPQAARDILAGEQADYIVMMIGMSDRQSIREKQVRGGPTKSSSAAGGSRPGSGDSAAHDEEAQPTPEEPAASAAPEPTTRAGGTSTYEFRSEQWTERYSKRIDEMITVLRTKGVPVFWVGVPALRGTRSSADMAYLNNLYRGRAEKAGITFVDVWDGFVDENGNFTTHGPDFEGQTRRLRSADGVYFTKAGAQKLAHYVEREIKHAMLTRNSPLAAPAPEEPAPQASARQGGQPARPVAGPVVSLTTISGTQEELLGGPARPPAIDASATKVLVKGEPPASLAGRADDFAWPKPDVTPAPPVQSEAPTSLPPPTATDDPADRSSPSKAAASPKPARSAEPPAHMPKRVQHRAATQMAPARVTTQAAPPRVTTQAAPVADDTLRPPGLIPPR